MAADFLALLGPTASGKTALSLLLAQKIPAEIVSMDSRQVYRGLDVGTAKVERAWRERVPHHGLDLVPPDERYSAGRFAREARAWMAEIRGRGRVPLLVGGTGFFLRALTDPIFREPGLDPHRRGALRRYLEAQPRGRLSSWARALDPERAELAVAGGPQRLARTLEVALLRGRPLSWWHRTAGPDAEPATGVTLVLQLPVGELDRRIGLRVERMLETGLVEEVRGLLLAGYSAADPGMTSTGYREVIRYLAGEWTLERVAEEIRRATRKYARRQLTWFRNQLPADTLRVDAGRPIEEQAEVVLAAWYEHRAREGGEGR